MGNTQAKKILPPYLPSVEVWYPVHTEIVAATREIVYLKCIFTLVSIETSQQTLSFFLNHSDLKFFRLNIFVATCKTILN